MPLIWYEDEGPLPLNPYWASQYVIVKRPMPGEQLPNPTPVLSKPSPCEGNPIYEEGRRAYDRGVKPTDHKYFPGGSSSRLFVSGWWARRTEIKALDAEAAKV